MKKSLLQLLLFAQILLPFLFFKRLYSKQFSLLKVKFSLVLIFAYASLWSQAPPHKFIANGSLVVPAGITTVTVEAWGAGGAGGGASGAVGTTGRSAGGGGGGAYAKSNITVVPGTTLTAIVAPQTLGTTSDGASGGNSTILNFEGSILARGGAGGIANTTGNQPAGGLGGSALTSIGGLSTAAGETGGAGNFVLISALLTSGKGGNGASPGGGNGGNPASTVVLGSYPGNIGNAPGGGGSGALNSAGAAAQIGGIGERGEVVVTYTCPSYSITGISVVNACATVGTAKIILNSSAASLPFGVYTVDYNLTNPVASGTATMSVTTAGTGNFDISGLTTVGTRAITITKLTSGVCVSNITTGNTGSIVISGASVPGSVTGGSTICSGFTSGTLTLGTHTGSIIKWQYFTASSGVWTDISNTAATYTSVSLTETTQFRAVIKNGVCDEAYSASTTVTVNPLPQGSLTANGPFCTSGVPQLIFTATNGVGPYTLIYKENGGADRSATGVISGTAFTPFTTPVLNTTTYTLVSVTGANTCVRNAGFTGGSATVTINLVPAAPTISNIIQPNCTTATGSIVVNGLPGSGNLLQSDGSTIVSRPYTGSSLAISGLAMGKYNFAIDNSCGLNYSTDVTIQANTWNGTSWSYGLEPTSDNLVNFNGDYNISADVNACSCTISNAAAVTIQNGKTLNVVKGVHVVSGSLTFADGSNLLQTSTDNNLNTGNITYKRASKPIRQADYVYWSTPVKGQTLAGVSPLTASDKYLSYDGTKWVAHPNTDVMIVGKGYIIRGPENYSNTVRNPFAVAFVGVPNNGDINGETVLNSKYYLIGNPYPSALNADDFILANNILEGTLHFWTHNTPVVLGPNYKYASDDYATYNLSGGVRAAFAAQSTGNPSDPENNKSLPSGEIAAGQSFFASTVSSGTIQFKNYMRRGGASNGQFYKPESESKTLLEKHRLWLNMTNSEGAFKQTLIGYIEGATNEYDQRYDGTSLDGNKYLDFYSINSGENLVIQGRALPFTNRDSVPLGYRTTIDGEFTIAIDQTDGNMNYQSIYLEDKDTGAIHDLRASNYTFTTLAGTFADRFVLRYTNKTLGTDDFENTENYVLVSVKDKIIKLTSSKENISEVNIFETSGKKVFNKNNVNATELQISNLQLRHQVLLIKVIFENGKTVTKKIVF
ncbi:T9SS sorting signal type C domain-containing protein [Flavobacterium sp. KJJ]|uniref:T9SS sorting signal type C domain-containing protein n=1 Tax=Flavobacterium sp. KJJ TaxID=1270193 RepID=UPI000690E5B6|nr:T9SS sorting signal type C domain-containing protein [Flavobacterium sp. KJJ]